MSKPVNPYTIGAFLVGSLALLIVAILILLLTSCFTIN